MARAIPQTLGPVRLTDEVSRALELVSDLDDGLAALLAVPAADCAARFRRSPFCLLPRQANRSLSVMFRGGSASSAGPAMRHGLPVSYGVSVGLCHWGSAACRPCGEGCLPGADLPWPARSVVGSARRRSGRVILRGAGAMAWIMPMGPRCIARPGGAIRTG
ncbi:hypothetical protein [Streptomyces sp. NRRL F-5053]|uniref:hypothetical protein n=1 Tax=Streptomyces sp. NRRL F-5053 TaxID=1463854 RepID=UPI003B64194E